MQTPSQRDAEQAPNSPASARAALPGEAPSLLVPWTRWQREFLSNLRDALWPRAESALPLSSRPAEFWPDVFVNRRLPVAPFRQSVLAHVFVVLAVWGITQNFLARQPINLRSPIQHSKITYYPLSAYLPPIDTGSTPAVHAQKGAPAYAKQPILSIPKRSDNRRQTIVTPSPLKLAADVPLPNIVAWNTPAPRIPLEAVRGAKLTVPPDLATAVPPPVLPSMSAKISAIADLTPSAVPPPPEAHRAKLSGPSLPTPDADAPSIPNSPDISRNDIKAPKLPVASAVPPPPVDLAGRKLGELNVGQMTPTVQAPRLPETEQANVPVRLPAARTAGGGSNVSGGSPADAPALTAVGTPAGNGIGQMIALSVHPALPTGPVVVPEGNRSGEFAATPEGKPDAPGIPEIKAAPGGKGTGGPAGGANAAAPEGIHVGPGPADSLPSAVAAPPASSPPAANAKQTLLAMARPKSVADLARETTPLPKPEPPKPKIEEEVKVFGAKRAYMMIINMPNLTSAGGGSWIMHFAELHESADKSELNAPVAERKVDPAYPQDLIRERIQGTVMLYAVIHADGSVSQVRVLRSVDQRLDENARLALLKWHFRPGTKHGESVDIEAVVQIPFITPRSPRF